MTSMRFALPNATWSIDFASEAVGTMLAAAQTGTTCPERFGQLFTRDLQTSRVVVSLATEVQAKHARRTKVVFDLEHMASQRSALYDKGWHFVGLWHTHPEPCPEPSHTDALLAKDHAEAAGQILAGMIFLIVGNRGLSSIRCWTQGASRADAGCSLLPMNRL